MNKGDLLLVPSYRRISLLSNINKIFEKSVYKRIYSFLDKLNCIYELQYSLRAKHSTNHALLGLTEKIRESFDSGKFACEVFIDLQKAFGTVDLSILLKNGALRNQTGQILFNRSDSIYTSEWF